MGRRHIRYVVDTTSDNVSTTQPGGRVKLHERHPKADLRYRRLGVRSPWNYLSLSVMHLPAQRLADIQADMAEPLRRLAAGKHTSSRGSQVGSHHRPTLGDLQATKAFDS